MLALGEAGYREVTLLGQNIDAYGRDLPGMADDHSGRRLNTFTDLLRYVHDVPGALRHAVLCCSAAAAALEGSRPALFCCLHTLWQVPAALCSCFLASGHLTGRAMEGRASQRCSQGSQGAPAEPQQRHGTPQRSYLQL
jgi:hypothetical protein